MFSRTACRLFAGCAFFAAYACSDPPRVHGVVMLTRMKVREPAASLDVYALPIPNDIDRALADLCAHDSSLNAIGGLEVPIGPVLVQGDGVELDASLTSVASHPQLSGGRAVELPPWEERRIYGAFQARMDSLLRRRAIASARTNDAGFYQIPLARRDSVELFAFTEFDVGGSLLIWRGRVSGDGTHDLPKPMRHMTHVYCGEP